MIPKIEFRYSRFYDKRFRDSQKIQESLKSQNKVYSSEEEIKDYVSQISKEWKQQEKKILKEIAKITKFSWKEDKIICYVIGAGRALSDPLTISVNKSKEDFIDILTHELIHQIHMQNNEKGYNKWRDYLKTNYKEETPTTQSHIALSAIQWKIYYSLFDKNRLNRDIQRAAKMPDYARAWQIVQEEGADNIIKKFYEVTK